MSYDTEPNEASIVAFQEAFPELLNRHQRAVLSFSGGRDSIALLKLLEPFLDRLTVVWLNTGNLFPEVKRYMEVVKGLTPHFVEIRTNVVSSIVEKGYPVDVLPIDYTEFGQSCTNTKRIKLRSYLECCFENISLPLYEYIRAQGYTLVLRGNRKKDSHKTPVENGQIIEGTQYVSPLWNWSDEDVVEYLRRSGEEITPRLQMDHSSLDCMACTAFTNHSLDRIKYIKEYHPILFTQLKPVFHEIDQAIKQERTGLDSILSM